MWTAASLEAGGEDAGEVFVVFDEKDVGGAFAVHGGRGRVRRREGFR